MEFAVFIYKKLKKSYSIKQNIHLKALKNTKYITQKEKKIDIDIDIIYVIKMKNLKLLKSKK